MSNYTEQDFEEHIEEHLLNSGYVKGISDDFDRELCLIKADVLNFILDTQPKEYEKLQKQYGSSTEEKLFYRLSNEIHSRGTLDVLRKGIKDRGASIKLAFFKPSSGMNPEHLTLYKKNIFKIVRQLHFSNKSNESLDLTIFLNGLPIITAELKNSLTGQFVTQAIKQYQQDRAPKEPLFHFKKCLVHFAIGNEKVFMTTKLTGEDTKFLPFNIDFENPVNPNGHKTAYLWEDILQKDTLLDLICSYLHIQKTTEKFFDKQKGFYEKTREDFIFPRFHQLDAVRTLLSELKTDGVGHNYLVQHSAGSGKSNTIAWLSHQLTKFYRNESDKERLFDSIIVVTDRKVLDEQLQNTIKQFEQTAGVVHPIDINSRQLKNALESGKDIIITTLQKFPVISESIAELKGKRFAVIIDEAHSSQSGESARHLKKALNARLEDAEKEDEDDFDLEDEVLKEIRARGRQNHISYFAFTATPKNKTIELFGKDFSKEHAKAVNSDGGGRHASSFAETATADRKAVNSDGKHTAHHIYSMRQAIEEEFILDVLENYTTFERYFKLAKKIETDNKYEKKLAIRLLTKYVDLEPHAIEMKTRIMLDHLLGCTYKAIQNRGRAMVVTRSRLHAIKFFQFFKKVIAEKNLPFKSLVAFSGSVKDPDSDEEWTEGKLNRLPPRVNIQDALKIPEYRILIVANKFQTGFDEPLLHTMYVDKKLGGVNAVQTLSRLNRRMKGKSETVVLDFVNDAETIQKSFQPYYQTTFLTDASDPNKLYDLQAELEKFNVFTKDDVEAFAGIFFNLKEPQEKLQPILDKAVQKWKYMADTDREKFSSALQSFIRLYGFICQMITFEDSELEKLYVFSRSLNKKLPKGTKKLPYELRDAVDLYSFRIQKTFEDSISLQKGDGEVKGLQDGKPKHPTDELELLSNIIKTLNDTYGLNLTDEDKVDIEHVKKKVEANDELKEVMSGDNTIENIRYKFEKVVDEVLLDYVHTKLELYKKLSDPKVNPMFKSKLFEGYKQEYHQRERVG